MIVRTQSGPSLLREWNPSTAERYPLSIVVIFYFIFGSLMSSETKITSSLLRMLQLRTATRALFGQLAFLYHRKFQVSEL